MALNFHNATKHLQSLVVTYPESWKLFPSKIFKDVDNYYNYRFAYAEYHIALELYWLYCDGKLSSHKVAPAIEALIPYAVSMSNDFPILFLDAKLLQAVLMSDIKSEVDWQSMRMPFSSFCIMLPKNGLKMGGKDIAMIQVAKVLMSDWQSPYLEGIKSSVKDIQPMFRMKAYYSNGMAVESLFTNPYNPSKDYPKIGSDFNGSDKDLLKLLPHTVFNILYAMAAKPELIESGRKIGQHRKSHSELWTPNIIGRKYTVKRPEGYESIGTGASKRLHWRRGHFRHQPYGKALTETKIIWLEPTLIGVKNAEA